MKKYFKRSKNMSKLIDLTGKDFGYWHVIERGENTKDGRA